MADLGLRGLAHFLLTIQSACLIADHVEIRGVDPELPSHTELLAFLDEDGGPISIEWIQSGRQIRDDGGVSTTGGALIRWPDRRVFLIDLGMSEAGMAEFGRLLETLMGAGPMRVYGSVGAQLDAEATAIVGVGLTHLHEDHTEGAAELCVARGGEDVPLHQTTDQAERRTGTTRRGVRWIEAAPCLRPTPPRGNDDPGRVLRRVPDLPGIAFFPVGGHTPGSTVFVVRDRTRLVLFAGDITNVHENLLENVPKGWVYSTLIVPESSERLELLRRWLAALDARHDMDVFVAHDPESLREAQIPMRKSKEGVREEGPGEEEGRRGAE